LSKLGRNIRLKRKAKGLKQKELAELAQISCSTLCDIEKGRINPSILSLQRIARVLEEPISLILDYEPENDER